MSKKVYLTEGQLQSIVERAAMKIVNEIKKNGKEDLEEGLFDFLKKPQKTNEKSPEIVKDINAPWAGERAGLKYNTPKNSPYNPYYVREVMHRDWPLEKCKEFSKKLIIRDIGEEGFERYKNQIWVPFKWSYSSTENF